MNAYPKREDAVALLKRYNPDPFHRRHAVTVEAVMSYFAGECGYAEDAAFWGSVGLLHDVDFGTFPEQHCSKAPELLTELNASDELVHAIVSHGWGICSEVKPEHEMERVLYATDELTGLIYAASLMRPSKSTKDMELSSLKKKFKDKKFAAGCSRDVIKNGAELLGWELDELLLRTLQAMQSCEDAIEQAVLEMNEEEV